MGFLNLIIRCVRIYFELLGQLVCWVRFRNHENTPLPPILNPIIQEPAISIATKIRNQQVTSVEVVKAFIERIKYINPILNCMVDNRFDEALKEAENVDNLIKVSSIETLAETKPFLGVPFTVKDLIALKGCKLTAGHWDRRNTTAEEDAVCVTAMRNAGAIPLGVTNVPELGFWWESYNTVYGRTNNAYQTCRIAGGSSGGEGAIISACGSALGIGSDLGGSIRMPAFFNGIFGHKPSYGIVSNYGSYPVVHGEMDDWLVHGPMCRHASDLIPMLKALAGDNAKKLKLDMHVDLSTINYFYIEDAFGSNMTNPVHPELKTAQMKVITHLEKSYNVKVKKISLKKLESAVEIFSANLGSIEGAPRFTEHLTLLNGKKNMYTETIKWLFRFSKHTYPAIFYGLFENLTALDHKAPLILRNKEELHNLRTELDGILGEDGVLLYPTHPTLTPYHDQPAFRPFNYVYTGIINILKMPATQCPLGISSEGTPLGIQVVANHCQDHLGLAIAAELEKAFGGWVSPSQG
ncbi:unnamed protein product [Meganyctiphanes norvegica]|uniref:Amidase domain-containing protein n=1 Tax=Meganyctiphanes norvegica TaxID=48144 RepID=A0AAV2SNB1_MEGNR